MPTPLAALTIRRLTHRDLPRCLDLGADRGWPRERHKWQLLLTAGTGYGVDDPDGDGLIGCFVLTRYDPELVCVSMVLVAERHTGRGLGRRLMRHALDEAAGATVFLVATPDGRPLYEELGFADVSASTMRMGRFRPGPAAAGTSTTRSATAADLPAMLRLDAEVFGSDRTHLITRLPAFTDQLRVAKHDGRLIGFAAAWPNVPEPDHTVIGPVVAEDTGTAQQLITDLAAHTDRVIRLDTDARHPELEAWLDDRGVPAAGVNSLMVHGAADLPGDHRRRFVPLSVALG